MIPLHRGINRLAISFDNENVINVFGGLIKKFSKGEFSNVKEFSKYDIWDLAFPNVKFRESEFKILLHGIAKSYKLKADDDTEIIGSIFIVKVLKDSDFIKIEIPQTYLEYFFSQRDIYLMSKAKNKKRMTTEELDYWDTVLRDKKKELLLLEEAELRGIRGKYAKRFYMLLKQFTKTGYFCMNIQHFRDVMEIPENYTYTVMNKAIINRSKAELEKKNLFEFLDKSKGKGRRKIDKIEVNFKSLIPECETPTTEKLEFANESFIASSKITFTPEEEREGIRLCVENGDSTEFFLDDMKKKSYVLFANTIKPYLKK